MFSSILDLSNLDGSNGFAINGISAGDRSGFAVSNAGDVNNDGIADIIIGAPSTIPNGTTGAGESYIIFGATNLGSSGSFNLSSLNGANGFIIPEITNGDSNEISVNNAGDINGDGIDDFLIGASTADPNGNNASGETYVVFGQAGIGSSGSFNLSTLNGTNGFIINGIDIGDRSGRSVSNAGDINGDDIDDLIIGAPAADPNGGSSGESYVVFGGTSIGSSGELELSSLNGSNGFIINGGAANDFQGFSVSNAGDVNNDGIVDIIVGASTADPNGNSSGESYVIFGSPTVGSSGIINPADLNGFNGFAIQGVGTGDLSGRSVSNAGDVNGDGIDDLLIGAPNGDPNGTNSGESYVIFGNSSLGSSGTFNLSSLNGSNGFVINGNSAGDFAGRSVSNAGDLNGDGIDDLIIGASRAETSSSGGAGESYVIFGSTTLGSSGSLELATLDGTNGFTIQGIDLTTGYSVSNAGDVNNDGTADIIIGAYDADANGNANAGQSYVVFGIPLGGSCIPTSGDDNLLGCATAGNDSVKGLAGNDTIAGGNGNDTLVGGNGEDSLIGGNDDDRLLGGSDADILEGDAGNDNLNGQNGSDTIFGGSGDDTIIGGNDSAADLLNGNAGMDILRGKDGDDILNGGADDDRLLGGRDLDLLNGGDGNDTLNGDQGNDTLNGDQGNDRLNGDTGADVLNGGDGADTLRGGQGNDDLFGGSGDDILRGEDSNDFLQGDLGRDTLEGGAGADRFAIVSGITDDLDVISDFTDGVDLLDLRGGLTLGSLTFNDTGTNTLIIETSTNETLAILRNFDASNLSPADFT